MKCVFIGSNPIKSLQWLDFLRMICCRYWIMEFFSIHGHRIMAKNKRKKEWRARMRIHYSPPSPFSPSSPLLFVVTLTVVCFSSTTVQHSAGHEYLNNESLWTNLEKLENIFPLSTTPCGHYWLIVVIITVEFYVSFFLFGEIQLFLIK